MIKAIRITFAFIFFHWICFCILGIGGASNIYASEVGSATSNTQPQSPKFYQVNHQINLRSGPGTDYDIITTCEAGCILKIYVIQGNWGKLDVNGSNAWVCLDLVTDLGSSVTFKTGVYAAAVQELTLRKGPYGSYESAGSLKLDQIVTIEAVENTNWGRLTSEDQTLWVNLALMRKIGPDAIRYPDLSNFQSEGYQPGWTEINGSWHYADQDGKLLFVSNTLKAAWNYICDAPSATNYFVVVNCTSNEVFIFTGYKGNWVPYQVWSCSTGKESNPTRKGNFKVLDKGYHFGEPDYTCYYYTEFAEHYLFHSVIYEAGTLNVREDILGANVSAGCIRLPIEQAKWIYDNIPIGTNVFIY